MARGLRKAFRWFVKRKRRHEVLQESRFEETLILKSVGSSCMDSLTQAEKEAYDRQWGWLGLPPSYREVEVFKHFNGFDPRYLSHYHYLPLIARRLNDYPWTKRFEHKALLGRFSNEALQPPQTFACVINGEWYDADFRQIPFEEAVRHCASYDAFVCKPASESADGHGVQLVKRGGGRQGKMGCDRFCGTCAASQGCTSSGSRQTVSGDGAVQSFVPQYVARDKPVSERSFFCLFDCASDGKEWLVCG